MTAYTDAFCDDENAQAAESDRLCLYGANRRGLPERKSPD